MGWPFLSCVMISSTRFLFLMKSDFPEKGLGFDIDGIRGRYGNTSLVRGSFINSGIPPLSGGIMEDYPAMRSQL